MSGCGSCSSCSGGGDKAQEYKNGLGQSAVKCPFCGVEITFEKMPKSKKIKCENCDTIIEIIPLLLN